MIKQFLKEKIEPHIPSLLKCPILGHEIRTDVLFFEGLEYCVRCDEPQPQRARLLDVPEYFLWKIKWNIKYRYRSLKDWVTCTKCGCHFGKHDETVDHIPF